MITWGGDYPENWSLPEWFVVGLETNEGGAKGWKCLSCATRAGLAFECPLAW